MLRATFLSRVNRVLAENSFFKPEDFEVRNDEPSDEYLASRLEIVYRFDKRYQFNLDVTYGANGGLTIGYSSSPGAFLFTESGSIRLESDVFQRILEWLIRLQEELLTVPLARELESQRQQISELMREVEQIPDTYFTRAEANEVLDKLNELEERLRGEIVARGYYEMEQEARLTALEQEIETLRSQVGALTKRGWFGSAAVRITRWAADPDNAKMLKGGVNVVKALLPGGASLPEK